MAKRGNSCCSFLLSLHFLCLDPSINKNVLVEKRQQLMNIYGWEAGEEMIKNRRDMKQLLATHRKREGGRCFDNKFGEGTQIQHPSSPSLYPLHPLLILALIVLNDVYRLDYNSLWWSDKDAKDNTGCNLFAFGRRWVWRRNKTLPLLSSDLFHYKRN